MKPVLLNVSSWFWTCDRSSNTCLGDSCFSWTGDVDVVSGFVTDFVSAGLPKIDGFALLSLRVEDFSTGAVWREGKVDFVVFCTDCEALKTVLVELESAVSGPRVGLAIEFLMIAADLNFGFKKRLKIWF